MIDNSEVVNLDLGAGGLKRKNIIGIDLNRSADFVWDVRNGLPCDDSVVDNIYSNHFFEHLELHEVVFVLKECYRVLKPSGRLRFTIPHIDPYISAWLNHDLEFLKEKIFDIPLGQEILYDTTFDRISWLLLRNGEHKSLFDKESIRHKVALAGFEKIFFSEFDESIDINFRFSSIYIEAIR